MSGIILQVLSVIGIVLLILLGLILLLLLFLLFWPVTYRISGEKNPEKLRITGRADWLFGVLKVRYTYPEPNSVTVRLLWKTLMDTGQKKQEPEEKSQAGDEEPSGKEQEIRENQIVTEDSSVKNGAACESQEEPDAVQPSVPAQTEPSQTDPLQADQGQIQQPDQEPQPKDEDADTLRSRIFKKIQKIKYTILRIYDKIKEIWANISYYNDLLHEENTVLLWKHVKFRLGKVLKNIRPRHIKAHVIFGTGAPDTTGLCLGLYSMLSPFLGKEVCLVPDFDRAVLEGTFDVSGHITLCTLIWNTLKLLLDKKLKLFMKKMKAGRKENGR